MQQARIENGLVAAVILADAAFAASLPGLSDAQLDTLFVTAAAIP